MVRPPGKAPSKFSSRYEPGVLTEGDPQPPMVYVRKLPQSSESTKNTFTSPPQLSITINSPFSSITPLQSAVISGIFMNSGPLSSKTTMVWVQEAELPQASV